MKNCIATAAVAASILLSCMAGWAADKAEKTEKDGRGAKLGPAQVERWRFGMAVTANGGQCSRLMGTTTVPLDWPEQRVKIVSQDLSPGVTISYRTYNGTAKQMIVRIASIADGQEARAIVTYEIERFAQRPPENTEAYVAPDPKTLKTGFKEYLSPSPYIESNHPRIKALAKEIGADQANAWDRVKAIYAWVNEKLKYVPKKKGAYEAEENFCPVIEALDRGTGDCNELTSTFIAICRAAGIPARMVRIPGHCFPEFYLLDEKGVGHWFPCEEMFGRAAQQTPILQKGDNFKVNVLDPNSKRYTTKSVRFLPELLTMPSSRGGQPQMKLVREPVRE
jgi:hypothetical protein